MLQLGHLQSTSLLLHFLKQQIGGLQLRNLQWVSLPFVLQNGSNTETGYIASLCLLLACQGNNQGKDRGENSCRSKGLRDLPFLLFWDKGDTIHVQKGSLESENNSRPWWILLFPEAFTLRPILVMVCMRTPGRVLKQINRGETKQGDWPERKRPRKLPAYKRFKLPKGTTLSLSLPVPLSASTFQ